MYAPDQLGLLVKQAGLSQAMLGTSYSLKWKFAPRSRGSTLVALLTDAECGAIGGNVARLLMLCRPAATPPRLRCERDSARALRATPPNPSRLNRTPDTIASSDRIRRTSRRSRHTPRAPRRALLPPRQSHRAGVRDPARTRTMTDRFSRPQSRRPNKYGFACQRSFARAITYQIHPRSEPGH